VIEIVLAVAFILSRRQWPPPLVSHEEHARPAKLLETLRLGKVQISLLVFLVYTGCESAAGAWVFSLLYEARDIPTASAGAAVTLYWGGLFASRLGYAFLPANAEPDSIIKLCMIAALAGVVTLLLSFHPLADTAAIALMGFAAGPIFPCLIATTPARVGPRHTANTVGLQISMGAMGLAALPAVCGLVAARWGLELIPLVLCVGWAVLIVAYFALRRAQLAPAL